MNHPHDVTDSSQHTKALRLLVIVCTYNRAPLLRQTLECITQLQRPEGCDLGIVVVNNACTDSTADVIKDFETRLPLWTVEEPIAGLSNARNRGIEAARAWHADAIIWTDDDVRPYPNWLAAYASAYKAYPKVAIFGGPVEPWFEVNPPKWISDNWQDLKHAFAVRDLGNAELELTRTTGLPFGANYSIRLSSQERHKYDPRLGVVKGKRLVGEETMVMRALLDEGERGRWLPEARVRHFIEAHRLTWLYVTRYFYGAGKSASTEAADGPADKRTLFGRPAWLARHILRCCTRLVLALVTGRRETWVKNYIMMVHALGQFSKP